MRSFIEEIQAIVGPAGLITLPQEVAPYASDWRKRYLGRPAAVVKPASTAEVAEVVHACAESRTAIVHRAETRAFAAQRRRMQAVRRSSSIFRA